LIDPGCLAAGVFQRIHFTVKYDAALLDTAVVAAAYDPVFVHKYRANRNSAF